MSPLTHFPVNPERDAMGQAVLYPGMKNYEGVAGLFGSKNGEREHIILAPSVEVLECLVTEFEFTDELLRERLVLASFERIPPTKKEAA